jgi:hypothetical protein
MGQVANGLWGVVFGTRRIRSGQTNDLARRNDADTSARWSNHLHWRCILLAAITLGSLQGCSKNQAFDSIADALERGLSDRYRSETTVTNASGVATHIRLEQDTAERMHIFSDVEFIVLPEGAWERKNRQWFRAPASVSERFKQKLALDAQLLQNANDVRDEGIVQWQGKPAHCFSYSIDMIIDGLHLRTHSRFYIDDAGREVGTEGDRDLDGEKSHALKIFTYDDSIRVNRPE